MFPVQRLGVYLDHLELVTRLNNRISTPNNSPEGIVPNLTRWCRPEEPSYPNAHILATLAAETSITAWKGSAAVDEKVTAEMRA